MFPLNREVKMGFLLLGIDSLIACVAIGPVVSRRWGVPLAALFGVCDGGGFLLGSALHWQVSGNVSGVVTTGILIALGVYWIAVAACARTAWVSSSHGLAWALPSALARAVPAARRHAAVANGVAGGALIVASGVLLLAG
jgi:hypothetical protein